MLPIFESIQGCFKTFYSSWTYFLYGVHSKHFTTKMSLTFWSSMLVPLNCFILMSSLYTQKVYLRKFNSHFNTRRRSKRDFCQAIENVTNKSNNSSLSNRVCVTKKVKTFLSKKVKYPLWYLIKCFVTLYSCSINLNI